MAPRAMHAERAYGAAPAVGRRSLSANILQTLLIVVASVGLLGAVIEPAPLVIEVDAAVLVEMTEPASTVFVANPEIADVQVPGSANARKFVIFGKKAGSTTVFALSRSGEVTRYSVRVPRQVSQVTAALQAAAPDARVEVFSAPNGLTISGSVASPAEAHQLRTIAGQFLTEKETLNFNVSVAAATQVNLRVRIAEVSRSADKRFGFNWSAISNSGTLALGLLTGRPPLEVVTNAVTGGTTTTFGDFSRSTDGLSSIGVGYRSGGGSVNVSGLIDALAEEGLVSVLAEPNLTAISGETANFLAGGEFPVPVPQSLQEITIEWKKFGVSVDFTPTVLQSDRLSIKVRPEVSELTDTGSVVVSGLRVPALAVRRAETTVELASGQSFAIAGLFQNNASNQMEQVPWLGDLPVLGALFRSSRFRRNESELVIIVTPYIVQPVAQTSDLHLPTDGLVYSTDLERVLLGRLTTASDAARSAGSPPPVPVSRLTGAAGFMLER